MSLADELAAIVGEDRVLRDEPMSAHTTFQVGGPADLFVRPATEKEVEEVLALSRREGVPLFVLGNGSDLLVGDRGMRGIVLDLTAMNAISAEGARITAAAGATLKDLSALASGLGLTGLEFACGIPGTVGGAVFMNAGAYGGAMEDVLESVDVVDTAGRRLTIGVDDLALGYRTSLVKTEGLTVLSATFALSWGDPALIAAAVREFTESREAKQPLDKASAGSTFKRPEGAFAGKLIQDAGLSGASVGPAQVSPKHSGFVVNNGGATASEVLELIRHVQATVFEDSGFRLEPEVRIVGEFDEPLDFL